MNILVTGGAGFIGSYTSKRLAELGHKVIIVDNFNEYYDKQLKEDRIKYLLKDSGAKIYRVDISNFEELEKVFKENDIEMVVHQAAQAGVRYSLENPFVYESSNIKGTLNLLELCKDYKIKGFIFASSSSVYGETDEVPFKEENNTDNPVSLYGATKKSTETLVYSYHHLYGIPATGLRYFTCFDEATEVLTPKGIKNIKDFSVGEEVYTLNPDTKDIEVSKVVATQKFKAPQKMVSFSHPRVELLVTEDHKMFVQTDKGFWHFYNAGTLIKRKSRYGLAFNKPLYKGDSPEYISLWDYLDENHQIIIAPHSGKTEENLKKIESPFLWNRKPNHYLSNKEVVKNPFQFEKDYNNCRVLIREHARASKARSFYFKMEDFIEFLGWYLTEGSVRTKEYAQITISQKNKKNREEIIKTIKKLGFKPNVDKKGIRFSSRLIRNYLEKHNLIGAYNKSIPSYYFTLSYDLRKILWETMMKGDGDTSGKKYNTVSKKLAEDFFHLSITLGKYARIITENHQRKRIFRVRLRRERINPSLKKKHRKSINYNKDFVYSITADKNHIIYAGKNKKFGWVGQCYGPWGRPDMALFKFTKNILGGKPIDVYGYGEMKRDFTYIDDIVKGVIKAVNKNYSWEIFNLGCGEPQLLTHFIDVIEKYIGKQAKRNYLPVPPGDVKKTYADTSKAKEKLNWEPKVSIEEGVKNFVEWYREYYENRR